METLTESEKHIIEAVRGLKPMQTLVIRADPQGKPDKFFVRSVQAFFLVSGMKKPVSDNKAIEI